MVYLEQHTMSDYELQQLSDIHHGRNVSPVQRDIPGKRVGQTFVMGGGTDRFDLWCRVESIDETGINFYVINGAWHGVLRDDSTMICFAPWGNTEHAIGCQCWDPLPKFRQQYYNEAIDWINGDLTEDIDKYLYPAPENMPSFDDMDDDIPF